MADLVIPIREYIGQSGWNWYTDEFEWASSKDDLRMAVEYAGYAAQPVDRIVLEIGNCYGGSVDEGLAMYHYLQELGVPVHTRILGTVASMGTILPLAGDTIEVAQTAQFMVHAPSNSFDGTAAQIAAGLKGLDNDTASLTAVYAARTGADAATIAQWMSQDTWFTAAEALAAGLCTSVVPLRPKAVPAATPTEAQARQHRQRFAQAVARADKRAPSSATPPAAPAAPASTPAVPMATINATKPKPRAAAAAPKSQDRKTLFTKLMEALGINEDGEEAEADGSEAADVQSTVLADDNGTLYHDGALAVDSVVYTDETLATTADAGEYDTEDSQTITVGDAGGVTAIGPMADAAATTPTAVPVTTAALAKRVTRLEASLATVTKERNDAVAERDRLKKAKPARPNADAPDPKTPVVPKANAAHHTHL